jgi:hypothetical protein
MRSLEFEESKVCKVAVWATEKAGRARLIIAGDEPAVWDWRSLCKGSIMEVTGKKLMWTTLAAVKLPELNSYNFEQLRVGRNNNLSGLKLNGYLRSARNWQELFARSDCFLNGGAWDEHSEWESNRTRRRR